MGPDVEGTTGRLHRAGRAALVAALLGVSPMAAEQTFFLTHTAQVSKVMPQSRDGRIALPENPDLASLVDWEGIKRYPAN